MTKPKLCAPIVGKIEERLLEEAIWLKQAGSDLAEWRLDCYSETPDSKMVIGVLRKLREKLDPIPILLTYRSKREGGFGTLGPKEQQALLIEILASNEAKLIDIEYSLGHEMIKELVKECRRQGTDAVVSYHNFLETPAKDQLIELYKQMANIDADLCKIAVMSKSQEDVLVLLHTSKEIQEIPRHKPFTLISMGELGLLTRIAGGLFGSTLTFASGLEASAPGQIGLEEMRWILDQVHIE